MPIMIMPGIVCRIRLFRLYGYQPFLISIKIILNMRICENNVKGSSTYFGSKKKRQVHVGLPLLFASVQY